MSVDGLSRGDPAFTAAMAQQLTISSRLTSVRTRWVPYSEQLQMWALLAEHQHLIVAKPRKTGISTATELDDYLWTMAADAGGNIVRTVFAINTDDKAKEHATQLADFAKQIGVGRSTSYGVQFKNGSEIVCMTAGGREPGRGGTIHRLHFTELPFCDDPAKSYHALRSSCADSAQVIIETTMDSVDDFTQSLWDGTNEFHKHFWRVEDHLAYRRTDEGATAITDEEWEYAMAEGFTDREAACWWIKHALANICAGNKLNLMHDFPQKEAHLFAAGVGRVIDITPEQPRVLGTLDTVGAKGETWSVEVYTPPDLTSGQCVVTVDTARGIKKSHSVVLVVDKRDSSILACMASDTIRYDDLATVARLTADHYKRRDHRAPLIVEDDGVGDGTCERLEHVGYPFERFSQSGQVNKQSNAERCITSAKRAIEGGLTLAPARLQVECNKLHKNKKREYEGPKDVVMSYGIALAHIEAVPYDPEYLGPQAEGQMSYKEAVEEHLTGHGGRPRWGV